ncbi:MAG: transposase [Thomasclavelia sp.]
MSIKIRTVYVESIHQQGEVIAQTKCAAEVKNILNFIKSAKERMSEENEVDILTGYEAGCLGFSLYHELAYHDIPCVILAPSTMHGSVKNKKVKNDKMDAFNIATNLMHDSYKAVHVPTEHDNEIKEYIGLKKMSSSQERESNSRSVHWY